MTAAHGRAWARARVRAGVWAWVRRGALRRAPAALATAVALLFCVCGESRASSARYCDEPPSLSAEQKDQLFRFAAVIKSELEASGSRLALIARSGLDLGRFGERYSHAGLSVKDGLTTAWAVRQLYYACDEQRPRVFDQGLSAFLFGLNDPSSGYISIVFVPPEPAAALERAVLDNRQALQLLGATYSANAYAFGSTYQNCNQWVAEMLAAAWGGLGGSGPAAAANHDTGSSDGADGSDRSDRGPGRDPRREAQRWLRDQGYRPSTFDLSWPPLMWLVGFVPWLHRDDHPAEDLDRQVFRVSMPGAIEAFVRTQLPGATRMELCHAGRRVVVRHGWSPIAEGCVPGADDTVIALD